MHRRRRGEGPGAPVLWRKPRDVDAPPAPAVRTCGGSSSLISTASLWTLEACSQPSQARDLSRSHGAKRHTASHTLRAGQGAHLPNMNQEQDALMRCCPLTDIAPGNQKGPNTVIKENRLTGRWRESQKQCRQPPGGWSPGSGHSTCRQPCQLQKASPQFPWA